MASSSMLHLTRLPRPENCSALPVDRQNGDQHWQMPPLPVPPHSEATGPLLIDGSDEAAALSRSVFLTREEVIRRRRHRVKQLARLYRERYWALMEELRAKYRQYYWEYGKSPFKEEQEDSPDSNKEGNDETGIEDKNRPGLGLESYSKGCDYHRRCAFTGCKLKAMALTNYCYQHILSDSKQKLYKPCIAIVGQVSCGKPILRSTVPSLCSCHLQKHQKMLLKTLKKGGINVSILNKAPKFSAIIAEYTRQIQAKRRHAQHTTQKNDKGGGEISN